MKLHWIGFAIAMIAILQPFAVGQDRLAPEGGVLSAPEWEWDYAGKLRETLLKDSPTKYLARIVCLPDGDSEWVVSVVRHDKPGLAIDSECRYLVVCAVAARQIFEAEDFRTIAVSRSRIELDSETALVVARAWMLMLQELRRPDERDDGILDQNVYHFSRSVPPFRGGNLDPLAGRVSGQIVSPNDGSLTKELVRLGEDLKAYASAKPESREKLSSGIRLRAGRLRTEYERKRRDLPQ